MFLADLRAELERIKRTVRPRLVFAFDVGRAGVEYTIKYTKRATAEGWDASAMQVRPDGEGTKKDWNDLLKQHLDWAGDGKAPLSDWAFDQYRYNGAITIAETARDKARLIADHKQAVSTFEFRHKNRLWSCKVSFDEETQKRRIVVEEIANCAFRLLYRERDEIADETSYFLHIDFPFEDRPVKARFSSAACANSGEFKKRMMASPACGAARASSSIDDAGADPPQGGRADLLHRLFRRPPRMAAGRSRRARRPRGRDQPRGLFRFRQGSGQAAQQRASAQHRVRSRAPRSGLGARSVDRLGPKAMVGLAFFVMSLAVQIRLREKSIGFLEITGPPGSGKSTLVEFLWKLLGRSGYGFDPNKATPAFIARSLIKVSNLPVGLIEGGRQDDKRGGHRQFDYNELLVLFNGRSPRGTGQKSNGVETSEPPFLGTIYLVQNERIDAIPAVLERLMSMSIDKGGRNEDTRAAAIRLEQWPMEQVSGTIVHVVRNEAKWLERYFERSEFHERDMRAASRPAQRPRHQEPSPACRRCRNAAGAVPRDPPRMGGRNARPDRGPRPRSPVEHRRRSPGRGRFLGKGRLPPRPRKARGPWRRQVAQPGAQQGCALRDPVAGIRGALPQRRASPRPTWTC
jgi:energy-coupling factor transporter ATP-binding protein EcfA2